MHKVEQRLSEYKYVRQREQHNGFTYTYVLEVLSNKQKRYKQIFW